MSIKYIICSASFNSHYLLLTASFTHFEKSFSHIQLFLNDRYFGATKWQRNTRKSKGNMATARFARLFTLTSPSSATPVASASILRSLAAVENGQQTRWNSGGTGKCVRSSTGSASTKCHGHGCGSQTGLYRILLRVNCWRGLILLVFYTR